MSIFNKTGRNSKKYLILIGLILIVICFILIAWRNLIIKQRRPISREAQVISKKINTEVANHNNEIEEAQRRAKIFENLTEQQQKDYINSIPYAEKLKKLESGYDRKIDFFAKVVDQAGEPVPSAIITIGVGTYGNGVLPSVGPDQVLKSISTDKNGIAKFNDLSGFSILVLNIHKAGYFYSEKNGAKQSHFSFIKTTASDRAYVSDENNPVIFHLWKISEYANVKRFQKLIKIPVDNAWHPVGISELQGLQIKLFKSRDITKTKKYAWTITLRMENGGILEPAQSSYTFQAPQKGYTDSWSETMNPDSSSWSSDITKSLFIKSENGKTYGAIKIDALVRDSCMLIIDGRINEDGGTNLFARDLAPVE